jgi:hypothetical protein
MGAEFYGPLGVLNGASTYSTVLTGAGVQHATLTLGKTYRVQAHGGDVRIGFGTTTSAADADAVDGKGETLSDGAPALVCVIHAGVLCIARTSVGSDADLIIRESAGS